MRATTKPMEGNLIRLTVEIDEPEFDQAMGDVVRTLAGKCACPASVPARCRARCSRLAWAAGPRCAAEALREAVPDFYAAPWSTPSSTPSPSPKSTSPAARTAAPSSFDAVVEVRPLVAIPGYDGLQVTLPSLRVKDEEVQQQIDQLRENDAELDVVERPAIDGDLVTIDLHGNDATNAEVVGVDDYLYEVGSGTVVPELDAALHGAKAGAILAFDAADPQSPDEQIAFRALVKEVKVKKLPAETDEWAAESSEFATVAELRADIEERIRRVKLIQTQMALRQKALEALSGLVTDDVVPEVLVDAEVNQRLHDLQHRLEAQKLGLAEYFQATGTSPDELLAAVRVDAQAAVESDLALPALVEAEELPLTEDELDAEIATMAERMDTSPAELRRRLDTAGRTGAVRSELRKGKALEWLLEHVDLVDDEGNPISRDDLKLDASSDADVEQGEENE